MSAMLRRALQTLAECGGIRAREILARRAATVVVVATSTVPQAIAALGVHEKRGVGEEMNSVSVLQSEKKLVDVTGIEPVTPCLQS
jgi:hypothetical protein